MGVVKADVCVMLCRGRRVAFSAFGSVTSLNGEPEDGVVVEAVGQGSCPQQEEATTEANGQFRVRGLQPGVSNLWFVANVVAA